MSDTPLATVAQLAAYLQEEIDAADASALLYLDLASGQVREYLEQQITATSGDTITLDPINGSFIELPEMPVTDVALVEYFDGTTWQAAAASTYTVSKRTGIIALSPGCAIIWPTNPDTYRVTYSHGFAAVPRGIVSATLGVAARAYSTPSGIDMERIGGYQVKYAPLSDFTPLELKALNRHLIPRLA